MAAPLDFCCLDPRLRDVGTRGPHGGGKTGVMDRIEVGVLGATGTVGRRLVRALAAHPWFHLAEVGASPLSAGRMLGEVTSEDELGPLDDRVAGLVLKRSDDDWSSTLLLSAMPGAVAGPLEAELARRGHLVVSNASSHRMDADVPLVIPEVNPDHLALLERQAARWPGGIVTNPNCSVVGLALALAPLERAFGLEAVLVSTLQALSGAGRPGPSALDALDNVIPHIDGEERKIAHEPRKILGRLGADGALQPAGFTISAQAHRVPVAHGHLEAVSVKLARPARPEDVASALAAFRGPEERERLPSGPERPIQVLPEEDRPQPKLDRDRGAGMMVSVGRIRPCDVLDIKFAVLVHNLVRGAAGAALLNAELCHVRGLTRQTRPA